MTDDTTSLPTIHILGGGPSGLSAAFHLTSPKANPDWKSRYQVVIHQLGWRLGGKGATGRTAERNWRVEEHGIHLFGNMYSNSLHQMYEAFEELDDDRNMENQFLPSDFQLVTDFYGGRWHGFDGGLPHNAEKPWLVDSAIASPSALLTSLASTVQGILHGQELPVPGDVSSAAGSSDEDDGGVLHSAWHFITSHLPHLPDPLEALWHAAMEALGDFADREVDLLDEGELRGIIETIEHIMSVVSHLMKAVAEAADKLRWIFVQLDLLKTAIKGTIDDEVLLKGIDSIDDKDYRTWLTDHGADPLTMQSSLLQAIPNTCMQYPNGDSTKLPSMAASAYLTFILRQLVAPGDAAYFFKIGTGETVILPIYELLTKRGVDVQFFHKVTGLIPSSDGSRVEAIDIEVQATTKHGAPYDPLATIPETGEKVWPATPNFDQLEQGDELAAKGINLESWWADWKGTSSPVLLGPDDHVIVALPPAAQNLVCGPALDGDEKWRKMIDVVETTPTQALQIWLKKPTSELGWRELDGTNRWLGPTYTNPISAFGDFSEVIQHEQWPAENTPEGLIYFCGVLQDPDPVPGFDDHEYPERQEQRVRDMAAQYLRQLGGLLPGAADGALDANSLDFDLLACYDDRAGLEGENRVDQQYYRANIDPNERYTVSAPTTLQHRLKAWGSSYSNITLSSDAIYTGFNIGSFEGSVMSGKLASHAVTGSPTLDHIYGYDFLHPNVEAAPAPPFPRTIDVTESSVEQTT